MEFSTDCLPACLTDCFQTSATWYRQRLWTWFFSLFDVASAWEVLFGMLQYIQYILHGLTSVLLCVPFIFAGVNLEVPHHGSLCVIKIDHIFQSNYIAYKSTFRIVLDLHCSVMSWVYMQLNTKSHYDTYDGTACPDYSAVSIIYCLKSEYPLCSLLWLQRCFLFSFWFVLMYNGFNIADKDA